MFTFLPLSEGIWIGVIVIESNLDQPETRAQDITEVQRPNQEHIPSKICHGLKRKPIGRCGAGDYRSAISERPNEIFN